MKLNFTIQKKTNLDKETVLNKIVLFLKDSNYKLIDRNDTMVTFDVDPYGRKAASKSDYYTKVDDGKFELNMIKQETTLSLDYRISILKEFIILSLMLFIGVVVDYKVFFLSVAFIINFLCKIYYLNTHFLNNVLDM